MALLQGGGYAEYALAYETSVILAPPSLNMKQLASIPEQWMTAYQLLFYIGNLQPNETVLLHAGASGVGQAAIQLIKHNNSICFATCRSDEKVACCLELGSNYAFNLSNDSKFVDLIKQNNNGNLINLILDPIGAAYISENIDSLAMDGRLVLYGAMGGRGIEDPNIIGKILGKRATIIGTTLRNRSQEYKGRLISSIENEVLPHIVSGKFQVLIDSIFPMTTEGVQQAHLRMGTNANIGKIVLVVNDEN